MVLSKRERYTAIIAIAAIGILVLDHYIVQPLLDRKDDLASKIALRQEELNHDTQLLNISRKLTPRWAEMANNGLRRTGSEAESELYNNINAWAQASGLSLPTIKSDRTEREKDFNKFTVRAAGSGSMEQIAHFLYRIQTAEVPVRVSELTISSHKEGTDDLTIQLAISTTYLASDSDKSQKPGSGGGAAPAPGASASAAWEYQ